MSLRDASDQATAPSTKRVAYRFAPLDRRGLVAGWRAGQVACVAAGLLFALLLIREFPDIEGVVLAGFVLVAFGLAATWPIQGLTAEQWAPQAVRYCALRLVGRDTSLAGAPSVGFLEPRAGSRSGQTEQLGSMRPRSVLGSSGPRRGVQGRWEAATWRPPRFRLRPGMRDRWRDVLVGRPTLARSRRLVAPGTCPSGPFAGLSIVEVEEAGEPTAILGVARGDVPGLAGEASKWERRVGAVLDERAGVATAVFRAAAEGFLMLEPREREARVTTWSRVLASLAREASGVHRIQWLAMSTPGSANIQAAGSSASSDRAGRESLQNGRQALSARERARHAYEELASTLSIVSCSREVLIAVSVKTRDRGCLIDEAEAVAARLIETGVAIEGPLGAKQLAGVMRGSFSTRREVAPFSPWPWPMAVREGWSAARVEGTWQRTFWVEEWPRVDVPADFLAPVLLADDFCLRFSVVMEPVSPAKAARDAEQRRTAGIADAELRSRGGFLATQRRLREEEALLQREAELADGHGHYRFSGYATVSATSENELEQASRSILQASAQAGIELRPCYGCQATAFGYTLPLCRGLA